MISVCIPVGPYPVYKKYLTECLESVKAQTLPAHDVVLIDDMAGLTPDDLKPLMQDGDHLAGDGGDIHSYAILRPKEKQLSDDPLYTVYDTYAWIWRAPWRLGIPAVANVGIALGGTDLVFQLSCDDKLKPDCLKECWKEWERRKDPLGYYWVGIEYSTGEKQALPCGHAMIPKALWRHTGGWPIETAVGACDPAFISAMLTHAHGPNKMGTLYAVAEGRPLYWHREHDHQYTKNQHVSPGAIIEVRKWFTDNWEPPKWGRYEP